MRSCMCAVSSSRTKGDRGESWKLQGDSGGVEIGRWENSRLPSAPTSNLLGEARLWLWRTLMDSEGGEAGRGAEQVMQPHCLISLRRIVLLHLRGIAACDLKPVKEVGVSLDLGEDEAHVIL